MPSRNRSADAGIAEGDDRPVEIVGEPIPCRDARHRIRQAFELLQPYPSTVPTRREVTAALVPTPRRQRVR
jgi:hypothetical protein